MTLEFIEQLARVCDKDRSYRTFGNNEHPYRCPDCGMTFRLMSGLLQHAESRACGSDVENGPLTKFCLVVASKPGWVS